MCGVRRWGEWVGLGWDWIAGCGWAGLGGEKEERREGREPWVDDEHSRTIKKRRRRRRSERKKSQHTGGMIPTDLGRAQPHNQDKEEEEEEHDL